MKYEILPHTADLRIRVRGKTLEELFQNALAGLAHVLAGDFAKGSPVKAESVEISFSSPTNLLIDFLNEVLYLSNVNKAVYEKLARPRLASPASPEASRGRAGEAGEIKKLGNTELQGTLEGHRLDGFAEDVKAVTYHGAEIKKSADGYYEVEILLDI